jgi:hypothetical protein
MYHDDDDRSNLTKIVIVALISATFVISMISFSCNAEAQTFGDNNNNNNTNSTLLTELFTTDKQSLVMVNGGTTTDPSNTITKVVPPLITTGSYAHPYYIGITGGLDVTPDIAKAMGLQEARGFLVTDVTAEDPTAKAGIEGGGNLLADITGRYIEISGIINIPKNTPNSSNLTNANLTSDTLTYQNSSYGITMQYPANWTKDEEDSDPNDNITNIVTFVSPLENTADNYSENLGIGLEFLVHNTTLDEYASSLITDYNNTITDFNLIELNTNITLGGGNNPAYGLLYTDREDGTNYKTMEIGTIIGDRVFFIEYNAEENKYSNYLPTIQKMINSLQIT